MNSKKALKTVGDWISKETHRRKYDILELAEVSQALIYLKKNIEQQNNNWISVSERLPEKDGEYLCTTVYGNVTDIWIDTFYKSEWTRPADVEFDYEIIAWQPLPEPYKEEEE